MTPRQPLSREDASCGGMDQMLRSVKAPRGPAPIRVLFVMDRLHETGGTLYYLHMLPQLDPARVTPLLCAFAPRHPIASRFEAGGVNRPSSGGRNGTRAALVIWFASRAAAKPIYSISRDGPAFWSGGWASTSSVYRRSLRFNCMLPISPARSFLNRQLMSPRWPAIAVSEAVRGWSIPQFGIPPDGSCSKLLWTPTGSLRRLLGPGRAFVVSSRSRTPFR